MHDCGCCFILLSKKTILRRNFRHCCFSWIEFRMEVIHSSVPELVLTTRIRKVLEDAQTTDEIDAKIRERCKQILKQKEDKIIPINLLKDIYRSFKKIGRRISLHELVVGAELVTKPIIPPPRDPELEARIQRLKIDEANREYRRMTQNVDPMQGNQKFSFQSDVKSMNRQLTSVLNFLVTVVAAFAFGYKLIEYTYGKNFPMQMMAGLFAGTVIFFVDLYFMVRYTPI